MADGEQGCHICISTQALPGWRPAAPARTSGLRAQFSQSSDDCRFLLGEYCAQIEQDPTLLDTGDDGGIEAAEASRDLVCAQVFAGESK
jgi:hypothetical protein